MTTVAVFADPPRAGDVFDGLVAEGPLDAGEAADLYTATLRDVCRAVEESGADLLVNYRVPDDADESAAREAVAEAVGPGLAAPDDARYEVQVGSTRSARVGNTVTHLLEKEGVRSVAAVDPTGALVERRHVDSAAMKLRQSEVVLGPAPAGRVWYAGFTEPVDFTDVYEPPSLGTLTERARSADRSVDFLEAMPTVTTTEELASMLVQIRARERAGAAVPQHTTALVDDFGLETVADDDGLTLRRA